MPRAGASSRHLSQCRLRVVEGGGSGRASICLRGPLLLCRAGLYLAVLAVRSLAPDPAL